MKEVFDSLKPLLLALVVFVLCAVLYFLPQFQGQQMEMGDIVNYQRMANEAMQYEKKTGDVALWTNALFGGMPTYQITAPQRNNMMKYVERAGNLWIPRPAGYFIMGMLGFYLLMMVLGVNQYLAIVGAICFAFTTNNMVIFEAGHTSKVRALMSIAPVIAGVVLCYRNKLLQGGLIFSVAFAVNVYANHPQMTFYLGITLIAMVILYLVKAIKEGSLPTFVKASLILILGTILGVSTSASKLWTTYEYGKDTMRGKPILTKSTEKGSSSATDGLAWEYAMVFSNSSKDLMSMIVPFAVGGGAETLDKSSAFAKELRKKGVNTRQGIPAPTYWGDLSINGGPIYMGSIIIFLLMLSFLTWRSTLKLWGIIAFVMTLLFSLGSNADLWNTIFFNYFPMFNKFRTPNSVIGITSVIVPMIAFLGLDNYFKTKERTDKSLYISFGITGGFCLILAFIGSSFFDFVSPGDTRYAQMGYPMDAIIDDRISMQRMSALKSLLLITLSFITLFMVNKGKISTLIATLIIGVLCFGDLFITGKRYLNEDSFVKERSYKENFQPREVDQQILSDSDPNFRVLDLSINTFNSSQASYFHKTIGGYHAAKLQRIEDIITMHISKNNQKVLNMLNTKYIITPAGEDKLVAQRNPAALGNAWFVNNIQMVNSADEEIAALDDFDPIGDAVIHKEFADYISGIEVNKEGSVSLKDYSPNRISYKISAPSEQLILFSEVWYGPDKGWTAYIDGKAVDHIRANYILRGLKVPAGQHEVVFEFDPQSYRLGEIISFVASILLVLGMLGFLFMSFKNKASA